MSDGMLRNFSRGGNGRWSWAGQWINMGDYQDYSTSKYLVTVGFVVHGVVERSDIVGALFGQTEGLLGDELDLRELQKSGRIGRIQVTHTTKDGLVEGKIIIPSSLDKVETAVLAATIETVDRVGPCAADMTLEKIEDIREEKRRKIKDRAAELLKGWENEIATDTQEFTESLKNTVRVGEITKYGEEGLPAGPNVDTDDEIIIVEGRADILNLLRCGIKNCIAVQGTSIPKTVVELSKKKSATAYLDGDRGGDIILNELLQVADIDYVARAPDGLEVEELTRKQLVRSLNAKIPIENVNNKFNKKFKESKPASKKSSAASKRGKAAAKKKRAQKKSTTKKRKDRKTPAIEIPPALKEKMNELVGTNEAVGFNDDNQLLFSTGLLSLIPILETGKLNGKDIVDLKTVIFDGIISQRIVNLAIERKLELVIGSTLRKVKIPRSAPTKFYSFKDFK
ncbi:MAG: DNA primase DnaG [Promethearchaeota archaeon]